MQHIKTSSLHVVQERATSGELPSTFQCVINVLNLPIVWREEVRIGVLRCDCIHVLRSLEYQ